MIDHMASDTTLAPEAGARAALAVRVEAAGKAAIRRVASRPWLALAAASAAALAISMFIRHR